MNYKNVFSSKTIWLNVIAVIIAFVWGGSFDATVMTGITDSMIYWLPLANGILRLFFTNTKLSLN